MIKKKAMNVLGIEFDGWVPLYQHHLQIASWQTQNRKLFEPKQKAVWVLIHLSHFIIAHFYHVLHMAYLQCSPYML